MCELYVILCVAVNSFNIYVTLYIICYIVCGQGIVSTLRCLFDRTAL